MLLTFREMNKSVQESETCHANNVRFICPRQNEPRAFIFSCPINGNTSALTCCDDKLSSIYNLNLTETEIAAKSRHDSHYPSFSQIIVSLYLIFVIAIVFIDFFSFMRINKKEKTESFPSREASMLFDKNSE